MILLFLSTPDLGKGLIVKTCENVSHNELVVKTNLKQMTIKGGSPPHPHDMAAANRTLSNDKTVPTLMNSLMRHFRSGISHMSTLVMIILPLIQILLV